MLPKTIKPDAYYRIRVSRVVSAANETFQPCHSYEVRGRVLSEIKDAVAECIEVRAHAKD